MSIACLAIGSFSEVERPLVQLPMYDTKDSAVFSCKRIVRCCCCCCKTSALLLIPSQTHACMGKQKEVDLCA